MRREGPLIKGYSPGFPISFSYPIPLGLQAYKQVLALLPIEPILLAFFFSLISVLTSSFCFFLPGDFPSQPSYRKGKSSSFTWRFSTLNVP